MILSTSTFLLLSETQLVYELLGRWSILYLLFIFLHRELMNEPSCFNSLIYLILPQDLIILFLNVLQKISAHKIQLLKQWPE